MTRLEIQYRPLDGLIPYARNSRTHSPEQVGQIAASIREFGWTNPILIDETGSIIAGHGRVLAAQKLGADEVPTITLAGLTDAQKRAYVIADNKLALNAGWDEAMLKLEIEDLKAEGFDLDLTGFDPNEIDRYLGEVAADPEAEWEGMPDFESENERPYRTLLVHFEGESAAQEFGRLIGQPLTDKTKYVWHPKQVKIETADLRYVSRDDAE